MIIAAIVAILQLLESGISGNKSILQQYCSNTAILPQHFHFGKGLEHARILENRAPLKLMLGGVFTPANYIAVI